MAENNEIFDWDDTIEDDGEGGRFVLLPEGDYQFFVSKLDKKYYNGSQKLPPCPEADLTLTVNNGGDVATVQTRLFLCKAQEWKLSQFFRCIGQKKHGEKLTMNWGKVPGSVGRCHLGIREWTGNDGNTRQSNEVQFFIDPDEGGSDFSL